MTLEDINLGIVIILSIAYMIGWVMEKTNELNITIQKNRIFIYSLITIISIISEWYIISIIYIISIGFAYRNLMADIRFKNIMHQAYMYHGKTDFIKELRREFEFVDDVCNLEKLKKEFDDLDNNTTSNPN